MFLRSSTCALLAALIAAPAAAQVSSGGVPASEWGELSPALPRVTLTPPDVEAYRAEDAKRQGGPLRFGAIQPVALGLDEGGVWDATADGTQVWRGVVQSPGALSLCIEFDEFDLVPGAQVFIYDPERRQVLGAYTDFNNQPNRQLLIEPLAGDTAIIEYVHPSHAAQLSRLHVHHVVHDYRGAIALLAGDAVPISGDGTESGDGGCDGLVDINCPDGANWQVEKRAVVRTISNNSFCSGALINNTAQDGTPFVYTADHCGQTSNTVFTFKYERPNCGSGFAPTSSTMSGCQVLASSSQYDNRLLRINNNVPSGYDPYFLGWTRSTSGFNQAVAISHPSGGPKKIAIDANGASADSWSWRVNWSLSYVLGGSSGGPLIDQNGRVRGSACCVSSLDPAFLCQQSANYGRFDRFWVATTASSHLDPLGSSPVTLDGFDPSDPNGGGPGGGPTAPNIASVAPLFISAIHPDGTQEVTLTGSGFEGTTSVTVDGVALGVFPPEFFIDSDNQMRLMVGPQTTLGQIEIVVTDNLGSDTANLTIAVNVPPALDLENSNPSFILSAVGLTSRIGSVPGDIVFLRASTSNAPSSLPGLVNLGLGDNFSQLVDLGSLLFVPANGVLEVQTPLPSGLTGLVVYVQAAVVNGTTLALPASATNLESGTILF
jgi:hypothetical protein